MIGESDKIRRSIVKRERERDFKMLYDVQNFKSIHKRESDF